MKTLYNYIMEAREYFNPKFGPEEVKVLFTGMAEEDEFDEELLRMICPAGMDPDTVNAILTAYFYSKSGMGGKVTDAGCEKFLDMIRRQPVERIKRIVGAGSEGMIYDIGDGKILKVIFDTDFLGSNIRMIKSFRGMIGKKFRTLPNVYKVTDTYIIREDVKPSTLKCVKYYTVATTKYPGLESVGKTLERAVADNERSVVEPLVPEEAREVMDWLYDLRGELDTIGVKVERNFGDFKSANLGETKDGRVVYFDW